MSFLFARYGFTTRRRRTRGSFFDRKKFNSWQAYFEYSARFSSGFSFGQSSDERELGQLRVLRQRGVERVDLRQAVVRLEPAADDVGEHERLALRRAR